MPCNATTLTESLNIRSDTAQVQSTMANLAIDLKRHGRLWTMCPAALNNQVHTLSRRLRSSRGRPTGDQAVGLLSKAFPEDCVQDLQVIASATHGANFIRHFWTTASAIRFSLDITASIAQANLLIPERLLDFSRRSHAAGRPWRYQLRTYPPDGCPGEGRPVEPGACRSFLVVLQD
jgi:hypothetical protein